MSRFLFQGGNWTQILLFHDRKYTEQCEKLMPGTCAMLKEHLPKRDVHHMPWTSNQNEQVLVLKMDVGTDVETHCGPANNILNVHLGISGTEGAKLIVADKEYGWEEGKVIAWDGSYNHRVHCKECKKDRIIMMVRYMHPDMTREHYRGNSKTHYEDVPKSWFPLDQEKFAKWDAEDKAKAEAAEAEESADEIIA
jgi:aspartyl/asparaginyl beta-hydroxylase (cupin superfamily)